MTTNNDQAIQELRISHQQLKAYLTTLTEHQIMDQQRMKLLEESNEALKLQVQAITNELQEAHATQRRINRNLKKRVTFLEDNAPEVAVIAEDMEVLTIQVPKKVATELRELCARVDANAEEVAAKMVKHMMPTMRERVIDKVTAVTKRPTKAQQKRHAEAIVVKVEPSKKRKAAKVMNGFDKQRARIKEEQYIM